MSLSLYPYLREKCNNRFAEEKQLWPIKKEQQDQILAAAKSGDYTKVEELLRQFKDTPFVYGHHSHCFPEYAPHFCARLVPIMEQGLLSGKLGEDLVIRALRVFQALHVCDYFGLESQTETVYLHGDHENMVAINRTMLSCSPYFRGLLQSGMRDAKPDQNGFYHVRPKLDDGSGQMVSLSLKALEYLKSYYYYGCDSDCYGSDSNYLKSITDNLEKAKVIAEVAAFARYIHEKDLYDRTLSKISTGFYIDCNICEITDFHGIFAIMDDFAEDIGKEMDTLKFSVIKKHVTSPGSKFNWLTNLEEFCKLIEELKVPHKDKKQFLLELIDEAIGGGIFNSGRLEPWFKYEKAIKLLYTKIDQISILCPPCRNILRGVLEQSFGSIKIEKEQHRVREAKNDAHLGQVKARLKLLGLESSKDQ